jgi:hypothetical protein
VQLKQLGESELHTLQLAPQVQDVPIKVDPLGQVTQLVELQVAHSDGQTAILPLLLIKVPGRGAVHTTEVPL